jgi:hypothetical protein
VEDCTFDTCPVQLMRAILQLGGHDTAQSSHVASVLWSRSVDVTTFTVPDDVVPTRQLTISDEVRSIAFLRSPTQLKQWHGSSSQ